MPEENKSDRPWINDIAIEDAQIKWGFSHFDGREDTFNAQGDYNFQLILTEEDALRLRKDGWTIREMPGYEEGDPSEFLLKVKISYRFEAPKIFLVKTNPNTGVTRKFRADERDLSDIQRRTTQRIDVIIKPNFWTHGQSSGMTAYVKEMYATIEQGRFDDKYDDIETV